MIKQSSGKQKPPSITHVPIPSTKVDPALRSPIPSSSKIDAAKAKAEPDYQSASPQKPTSDKDDAWLREKLRSDIPLISEGVYEKNKPYATAILELIAKHPRHLYWDSKFQVFVDSLMLKMLI